MSQIEKLLKKETANYNLRLFRKRFIPLEVIAKDPKKYGYSMQALKNSNAKQDAVFKDKHKVVVSICANRSGKTIGMAPKFLKNCLTKKNGGRAWILTESFDAQKSGVQEAIQEYLKPENIKNISYAKHGVWSSVVLTNGVTIDFKTYEQGATKLQSAKLFCAWLDEEPPEDIYDEVYTRTIDLKGQVLLSFTPLQGMTWSYSKIYNNKGGMVSVYNWGMADNPFIPRTEIEECMRNWSSKKVKMRLFGQYQGSERAIYESFYRQKHIKKDLFKREMPVDVSVDWGIGVTAICFFQSFKGMITDIKTGISKMTDEHYLVDAVELTGHSYPQIMKYILSKNYWIDNWYCDPAGRGRSQATKSGKSLLELIREEFNIRFSYITKLGVEESIDIVSSYFENAKGEARLFFQEGIQLNQKGDTPEQRIENYVRDEDSGEPIKDGISDHFSDCVRYYLLNKIRTSGKHLFQH